MMNVARHACAVGAIVYVTMGCSESEQAPPAPASSAGRAGSGGSSALGQGGSSGSGGDVRPVEDASDVPDAQTSDAPVLDAGPGDAGRDGASEAIFGSIVPLYSDPGDPAWSAIVAAKTAHSSVAVVAIVNPASGPGTRIDPSYTSGIDRLLATGIVPIGYVSTSYTKRGEPAVKADIDRWLTFYPKVKGIFFDEQSDAAGDDAFYRDVDRYAKSKGLGLTVGNPGTGVPAAYFDTVDVMLIYESAGLPPLTRLAGYRTQRLHYGVIPYAAQLDTTFVAAAKADVGYVYITSDDLPNPWDTLPPFFDQLLDALSH